MRDSIIVNSKTVSLIWTYIFKKNRIFRTICIKIQYFFFAESEIDATTWINQHKIYTSANPDRNKETLFSQKPNLKKKLFENGNF
jgi:hypothetical protein